MNNAPDVLIVGAGPTALMLAALLSRHGVSFRIVDKSPGPAKESRAMVMQPRSLELLLGMGLAEAVMDRGVIVTGAKLVVDGKSAAQIDFDNIGRIDTPFPFPLMIPQSETEAILLGDLEQRGLGVEYGATVTAVAQDESSVSATITKAEGETETVQADYLVGADGAHSIVRKTLGLSFAGAAYTQDFLLADCAVHWSQNQDQLSIFLHGTELAAFLPMRGSTRARIITVAGAHGSTQESLDTQGSTDVAITDVETSLRRITCTDVSLTDAVWTSRYRVHHRGVDRYRVGRMFVAGDAAHIHSPAGGQGMNTGLQDAANLAWKLAAAVKEGGNDELLDTYHGERWPVGRKILERTDRMFAGMTSTNPLFAAIRNAALPLVAGPALQTETFRSRAFHFVSELGIRYHLSRLVEDDLSPQAPATWRTGFRAGSRAPDGRISRTKTVFDLLSPDAFTLLVLSRTPLTEDRISEVSEALAGMPATLAGLAFRPVLVARSRVGRDARLIQAESTDVFASYGLEQSAREALILVRPDGYIAYRSDRIDFGKLRSFIDRYRTSPGPKA